MSAYRPVSPDPLRTFLRDRLSPEQVRSMASADYDRDGPAIAEEFDHNLRTGSYSWNGDGNPYECCLLQMYGNEPDRPIRELFAAWWIGVFCSDPQNFVLIDNMGLGCLLGMVVRGCGELRPDPAKAAHAAIPFVRFLQSRTAHADSHPFAEAIAALEAVERLGERGIASGRYQDFMRTVRSRDEA